MIVRKTDPKSKQVSRPRITLNCSLSTEIEIEKVHHTYPLLRKRETSIPSIALLRQFLRNTLIALVNHDEFSGNSLMRFNLNLRIVDSTTSQKLNRELRSEDKPTNVISVDYGVQEVLGNVVMGDLIFCLPVIIEEAKGNKNDQEDERYRWRGYWAHLCVHGLLHILGYDHQTQEEEVAMQKLELLCLQSLGFDRLYI